MAGFHTLWIDDSWNYYRWTHLPHSNLHKTCTKSQFPSINPNFKWPSSSTIIPFHSQPANLFVQRILSCFTLRFKSASSTTTSGGLVQKRQGLPAVWYCWAAAWERFSQQQEVWTGSSNNSLVTGQKNSAGGFSMKSSLPSSLSEKRGVSTYVRCACAGVVGQRMPSGGKVSHYT